MFDLLTTERLVNVDVAIKIIDKTRLDAVTLKNLYLQAEIMKKIKHTNITRLFEIIETEKELSIVLELTNGGDILDYIVARGRIVESEARGFFKQILSAVEYLHSHGITHRDLKPEHFLLDGSKNIKLTGKQLLNFIVLLVSRSFEVDDKNMVTSCGSTVYSSPELLEGIPYYGKAVDCWSLGVSLYAMVVGDLPFTSPNVSELHEMVCNGDFDIPDDVSPECRDLITHLLRVKPKKRFTIRDIKEHVWFTEGLNIIGPERSNPTSFKTEPLKASDLNMTVIKEMDQVDAFSNSRPEKSAKRLSKAYWRTRMTNGVEPITSWYFKRRKWQLKVMRPPKMSKKINQKTGFPISKRRNQ
jgi:serine/threonine protein kinase